MGDLSSLPNVGKVLEQNLRAVGIHTREQLRDVGSREAFLRIRLLDPGACLHMLYGLEGAVRGIKDSHLDKETKLGLKAFYQKEKGA